ncbi:PREDICTED: lysosomal Pro-X carboxypeptidase-like isoform X1 [Nelumbo nucifera]|uniref:Lysosomal Pro-X carboxypeptidase-like isoform X1 n=1 Tax=Nelumbo nucifera TaxID=4432 RepID=A0A1U7ZM93_NELNU|nr:PREDICTED: lysosomal Pro-X carboxypeptidase-like isoform X1 [Nelumbo nucifera]
MPSLSVLGITKQSHRRLTPFSFPSRDFNTYFYTQKLDHFNYRAESQATFQQKYVINSKFWGGANSSAPIFVYLGANAPLDDQIRRIGFMTDNAPQFNALLVYIEHRFYGQSTPFGSSEEAYQNDRTLDYLNLSQTLEDYAEVILDIKKNLSANNSTPVIVIGGSYGGVLATLFRLRYPYIALGALASSAPILYLDGLKPQLQDGYFSIVSKDFREASESCYNTIQQSWSEIDKIASQEDGLSVLSRRFNTCTPLENSSWLKDALKLVYAAAAQYDAPQINQAVNLICTAIDRATNGTDVLDKVIAAMFAFFSKYPGPHEYCDEMHQWAWNWQICTEILIPTGISGTDTMFQAEPFNLTSYKETCKGLYDLRLMPEPFWITSQFGGQQQDVKLVLGRFGSNIIFSNGLRDPFSAGGVLESLSDSLVALPTAKGSHCLDIYAALPNDPDWLIVQRRSELKIISQWIAQYHMDRAANISYI